MHKFPLAVPTVSLIVARKSAPNKVYVVRFRTKHKGGVGVPGGRWPFQREGCSTVQLGACECAEELGLKLADEFLEPLTVRAKARRDVRVQIAPGKYTHKDPIPPEIDAIPADQFEANHCVDLVYLARIGDVDPAELIPKDTVEVVCVEMLDVNEQLPPLPISDDALLLSTYGRWVRCEIPEFPRFLHG